MAISKIDKRRISRDNFGEKSTRIFEIYEKYIECGNDIESNIPDEHQEIVSSISDFVKTRYHHKIVDLINLYIEINQKRKLRTEDSLFELFPLFKIAIKEKEKFDEEVSQIILKWEKIIADDNGGAGTGEEGDGNGGAAAPPATPKM